MSKERGFVLAVIVQLVFILGVIIHKETILTGGHEIRLRLRPLDPRSLLQGDYVILRYQTLNNIPKVEGQTIEIVLKQRPGQNEWLYERLHRGRALAPDEVLMRGTKTQQGEWDFGIGQFFVEAGTGRKVERTMQWAILRVSADGEAIVKRVE